MKKVIINGQSFDLTEEMLEKDEITLSSDGLIIRTTEDDEKFQNNIKTEAKKAGVEIAVKEARTKLGLEFEGKNIDKLIEAVQSKTLADAKIEPEEKLKNALKDIESLKAINTTLQTEKESDKKSFESFKNDLTIKSVLQKSLPENLAVPSDDMVLILKNKMTFETLENGSVVVKDSNGEIIKNQNTLDPKPVNEVLSSFFDENKSYLKGTEGGAGGKDSGSGGNKMTVEKFIESQKEKGININSETFNENLNKAVADGLVDTEA
jgi:hypothetical protein